MRTVVEDDGIRISDCLWEQLKPLIPKPIDNHPLRCHKPRIDDKKAMDGIFFVLRTGCQWKALPAERYGSASAIHARFLEWEKAGFFEALWKAGLAEYDDFEGIAWRWQSIDGAMMKAPLAQSSVGPNPTDRGKKWKQTPFAGGRSWRPVVARRDRSQPS